MEKAVDRCISKDVSSSRQGFLGSTNACFAVTADAGDPFLELSRGVFRSATEQVHEMAGTYEALDGVRRVALRYTKRLGFYLDVEREPDAPLPRVFVPFKLGPPGRGAGPERGARGGGAREPCITAEISALNMRIRDAAQDCMLMSLGRVEELIVSLRPGLFALHGVLDGLALLDMLGSFASLPRSTGREWTRPQMSGWEGPVAIEGGRHPVAEATGGPFQPNDVFINEAASLHIIRGVNGSGKSTLLKQVACTVVLAQAGCLVPATFASLRVTDKIFTRLGSSDSIEHCTSSFATEMLDTAFILQHCTPASLVLVDELGRSTSSTDGLAIAWAVAEELATRGSYTMFATHFPHLSRLADLYPCAQQWVLAATAENGRGIQFSYELKPGGPDIPHYGLLLGQEAGIPSELLGEAKRLSDLAEESHASAPVVSAGGPDLRGQYDAAFRVLLLARSYARGLCTDETFRRQLALVQAEEGDEGAEVG